MKSDFQVPKEKVPREIEAALVIFSETPEVVARKIASLTSVANYRLLPQDSKRIHDLYFDTPERALQGQKLALRLRGVGSTRWITLKGPSQLADWGGVERLEIEELWSRNAVTRVAKELTDREIEMPQLPQDFNGTDPLDVMVSLGLKMIQNRETHRQIRDIVFPGKEKGTVLAELAIDSVGYNFGDKKIRHHEVEIEAKVEDGYEILEKVNKSLIEIYGPALRSWKYSKLATGKAVEKLLGEGALEGLLDINDNLKPVAYDKIDGLLSQGNI